MSMATSEPPTNWTPTHRHDYNDDDENDEILIPTAIPIPQPVREVVEVDKDLVVPHPCGRT